MRWSASNFYKHYKTHHLNKTIADKKIQPKVNEYFHRKSTITQKKRKVTIERGTENRENEIQPEPQIQELDAYDASDANDDFQEHEYEAEYLDEPHNNDGETSGETSEN
jgi:hypothetical protein